MSAGVGPTESFRSAERMKFFTDAVVAIAMTLLILPLLEAVTDAVHADLSTAEYVRENGGSLFSFALSFVIIARFWMTHHALYEHVDRYTPGLMWLNMAWMFTIVWLPVPTAMVGGLETDRLQLALYIGSMLANSLLMVVTYVVVRRSPQIWSEIGPPTREGLVSIVILAVTLGLSLGIAVLFPNEVGYAALLVLFFGRGLTRLVPSGAGGWGRAAGRGRGRPRP